MGFVFDIVDWLLMGSRNWKLRLIWIGLVVAFFGVIFLMAPRGSEPKAPPEAASGHG